MATKSFITIITVILGLLYAFTLLLTYVACKKSDHPDPPPDPVFYGNLSVAGRITDNSNAPVGGATVKVGTSTTTTDINGYFRLSNVPVSTLSNFVKVEKQGFFPGSRTFTISSSNTHYVAIQLIKKTTAGTFTAAAGGNITVPDNGGSIMFPANGVVNTAGNTPYTGTVSVSAFFINPASANFQEIMPGALRGINTSNRETGLQSFGLMAVELSGAAGEKLQLASGKTATLTFPIPAALQAQAPATIPLWSF